MRSGRKKVSPSTKAGAYIGYHFVPRGQGTMRELLDARSVRVAKIVGETLVQLGAFSTPVPKEDFLKAARPKSHPLHDEFEWDDAIAGERFRLLQAVMLIRRVRFEIKSKRSISSGSCCVVDTVEEV